MAVLYHEEREVAVAEQIEDHERRREEAEPQHDVHVLVSYRPHHPAPRQAIGRYVTCNGSNQARHTYYYYELGEKGIQTAALDESACYPTEDWGCVGGCRKTA